MAKFKKIIFAVLLSFISIALSAQVYTPMTAAGYKMKRVVIDSTLHIPSFCGVPKLLDSVIKTGAIAIDTCNNVFFKWTKDSGWTPLLSTGTYLDTNSLSNRINQKLNISDTSGMLVKYLRRSDTSSLSNRINQKLNISDTNSMLNPYKNKVDSIFRTAGKDSIQFRINGRYRAIKDSIGIGSSRTISTSAPLTGGGDLSANRTIGITKATSISDGYISAQDYDKFVYTLRNVKAYPPVKRALFGGGGTYPYDSVVIFMDVASSVNDGYLNSIMWNLFYNKVDTIYKIEDSLLYSTQGGSKTIKIGIGGLGTVTNISQGYGITNSPNPITTTGTIIVDSATLSNKYLRIVDTTNKFVNNVYKLNDSTIRVIKGTSITDITVSPTTTVTAATRLVTTVYNNSGSTITKGSVVYINGRHSSNYPTIALAQANTEQNSYSTFAMVQDDILNNNTGTVIQAGNISNLNLPTATYTDGQVIYLSPTVAGEITTTKPLAPNHIVKIGTVTRAHPTLGSIELKIENGWQLDELSDVQIAAVPADSTILQFSRVDSLWHDVNPTTAMGNRFVRNISRVPGKDSIIFTIGTTRYAIKDSLGAGASPGGTATMLQFNNNGFDGTYGVRYDLDYNRLDISNYSSNAGTQQRLSVFNGDQGDMPRNYEIANFSQDGDTKIGIYNSGNYTSGGASIMLGHTKNQNSNAGYPGFEIQNGNDSANASGFIRFNYVEKDVDGDIANASTDLLTINSNGIVQINPTDYGVAVNPRLVVGADNYGEAQLEVTGASMLNGKLTTTGARNKHIVYVTDDVDGATYNVTSSDHIIIYRTIDGNCTVNLPTSPENGRELTIKQIGDYTSFTLTVDAGSGGEISDIGGQAGSISSTINSQSITLVYYDGVWYLTAGQLE